MASSITKTTTVDDYIPKLQEMYPELEYKDIKCILEYGWRMLYLINLSGNDTCITSTLQNLWLYIGDLCVDSMKYFNYYKCKLTRKFQFIYSRLKPEWDGYYYTALTQKEYDDLRTVKRGRKRKHYIYKNKMICKSLDACKVYWCNLPCIIRFKMNCDYGFKHLFAELKCDSPEIVLEQTPQTFKDILVTNNEYELL